MRIVGALLLTLSIVFAGVAMDRACAAPKHKRPPDVVRQAEPGPPTGEVPTNGPLRAIYDAMSLADRVSIQSDLIWTGDYNGVTDGQFGDRSIAAVKAFQKRYGGKDTGVLTPQERDKLVAATQSRVDRVGWQIIDDQATGARIGLPSKLVPRASAGKLGSHWQSTRGEMQVDTFRIAAKGTTLASVLEQQKKDHPGREVEYSVVKPDFFVISGLQNGVKKFYVRAHANNDEVRGIAILYDVAMEGIVEKVVVAMSSAFTPFPDAAIASQIGRTHERPKVEYATGIIVSPIGHILTDRPVVDRCQFIVVPGLGNAERIVEDNSSNLALLRVYGVRTAPIAMADTGGADGAVTLIGVADPHMQNGGAAVSKVQAHLTASAPGHTIAPAPTPGFDGSAAINGEGRLTGMVELKPLVDAAPAAGLGAQPVVVPVETLRDFLSAQLITPRTGHADGDDAAASVVRVICVRQ
jgi:peptidoglycan hydrolase-like protein with peptidoglycan-binding domain